MVKKNNTQENNFENELRELGIEDMLKVSDAHASNIENTVYGSTDMIRKELGKDDSRLTKAINELIKDTQAATNGDMIGALDKVFKKYNDDNMQSYNDFKEVLENNDNMNIVGLLFNNTSSILNKHEDLEIITNLVPQINDAVDTMVDSIISPDDNIKQVTNTLKINNKVITNDDDIFPTIAKIKKENKMDKYTKEIVKSTLIHGVTYASVVSFSDAFKKFFNDKNKKINENVNSSNNISKEEIHEILNESFKNNKNDFKNYGNTMDELSEKFSNITVNFGNEHLMNEILLENGMNIINPNRKELEKLSNKNVNNDGFINSNVKNSDEEWNVPGCIIKTLDVRNTIPIQIDNCKFGYFYIENTDTVNALKRYNGRQAMMGMKPSLDHKQIDNNLDMLYSDMADIILKKVDKKFVEDNQDIKEQLYTILKYNESLEKDIKITFLRPDEVVEFEIEEGILDSVLFFAKLYLGLMISSIMMKISRSNDIRAYYLKTGVTPDVAASVNTAIRDLKKDQKTLMHINHIPKLIQTYTKFTDLVFPTDKSGSKPIDFDIIGGQDASLKDDLLEMLQDIVLNGMGVPTPLLNTTNEVDYVRRLTMLNAKYLRRIITYQTDLNIGFTDFYKAVIKSCIDKNVVNISDVDSLEYEFNTPMILRLQTMLDQIVTSRDLSNNIASILLGDNNDDQDLMNKVVYNIIKKNAQFIPWDEYEEIVNKCKIEVKAEKLEKENSENM